MNKLIHFFTSEPFSYTEEKAKRIISKLSGDVLNQLAILVDTDDKESVIRYLNKTLVLNEGKKKKPKTPAVRNPMMHIGHNMSGAGPHTDQYGEKSKDKPAFDRKAKHKGNKLHEEISRGSSVRCGEEEGIVLEDGPSDTVSVKFGSGIRMKKRSELELCEDFALADIRRLAGLTTGQQIAPRAPRAHTAAYDNILFHLVGIEELVEGLDASEYPEVLEGIRLIYEGIAEKCGGYV